MARRLLTLAVAGMLAAGFAAQASAQDYPTQAIKLVIAFGPGGGSDIVGRIVAQRMQEKLGQPIVIENKPGAGGLIGNEQVANAPKDGYTIGIQTAGQVIGSTITKNMRYDTIEAFEWIGQIATAGLMIVVRPDYEYKDVKSLVAAAKAAPGKLVFASPGFGATQHMAAELFKQNGNIDMLHVPYRTSPEAISALLGKNVDVLFDTVSAVLGQVESGQLKVLAVTGKDRFPAVPNVPTVMESGVIPDYDVTTWYGFFAPKGTPRPIVDKLNRTLNEVLAEDAIKERLTKAGVVVKGSTPDEWRQFMIAELRKWSSVREKAGIEQR